LLLLGSQDVGPTKYLLALDNYLHDTIWVGCKQTKHLLTSKNIVVNWNNLHPKLIISGTSLGTSLDKALVSFAKEKGIPSVSIIEHWSWYKKRFAIGESFQLPDYIIVNDEYAKSEAIKEGIPAEKIFVGGNPHLENIANMTHDNYFENARHMGNDKSKRLVLFITEAIKDSFPEHSNDYLGYDEFDVLSDLLQVLPQNDFLYIKTHPEEKKSKYDKYMASNVKLAPEMSLKDMSQIPDIVIGMASMLLIELAMVRNDIISYRPNARKQFIGDQIGATIGVSSKEQLIETFTSPPLQTSSIADLQNIFNGSGRRISNYLYNLL